MCWDEPPPNKVFANKTTKRPLQITLSGCPSEIMEEIHSFVWIEYERRLRDLKLFLLRSKKMKRRRLRIFVVIENKMEISNTYVELKDN